jgi:hypothetical protein
MMVANSGKMFDRDLFARFERLIRDGVIFCQAPERQRVAS